jgi:hypothetical protein
MKLVTKIQMCSCETYSKGLLDKNLSDAFPVQNGQKEGGALLPLLFNFDVHTVAKNVSTMKNNAEALLEARSEAGLEVNTDKSKYMVASRYQIGGQNYNLLTANKSFEMWQISSILEQQ